jgi:hypothetical protein
MVKPSEVVDALVAMLQAIPDLVDALNGDSNLIYAYLDTYPQNVDREKAVHDMPSPSVMVRYEGTFQGMPATTHRVLIICRPGSDASGADLAYLVLAGIPIGEPRTNIFVSHLIHADLEPLRQDGDSRPQLDTEGVEYWQINASIEEKMG